MDIREILTAATIAAVSADFTVDHATVGVIAAGLAGAEVGVLQIKYDGINYIDVYANTALQQLTATNNVITVYGPGIYRINKGVTAAAVSLHTAS